MSDQIAAMPTIRQSGEVRSARLESLRAIAALGVLTGHIYGQSHRYSPARTLDTFGHRILFGGGYGVFLFFALTGYLLFWPFAQHRFGSGATIDLRRYAINRTLRIFPLYYAALVFLLIVQEGGGSGSQWWRFMTFSENFSGQTVITVDGPMWSLVVELHYYLLLPLLAWALGKLAGRSKARAALILVALGVGSYFLRRHAIGGIVHRRLLELSLPGAFMYFVPGMLLALLRLHWGERRPVWMRGPLASADVWLIGAITFTLLQWHNYEDFTMIAIASFLALGACLLPLRQGPIVGILDWRPLAAIGVVSYSIYLWHNPLVIRLWNFSWLPHSYPAQLVIAGGATLAVAFVSYALIEAPFLRLRRQWSPASAPDEAAAAAQDQEPAAPVAALQLSQSGSE